MLIEFPCPKCGGPALTQDGEVSCPLCGNLEAPPEAVQFEAVASGESVAPVAESVEIPNVIEFEVAADVAERENWTEVTLALAVEYLLGFVEAYDGLPKVELRDSNMRLSFSPSSGQANALAEICSRYSTAPEALLRMATALYIKRER